MFFSPVSYPKVSKRKIEKLILIGFSLFSRDPFTSEIPPKRRSRQTNPSKVFFVAWLAVKSLPARPAYKRVHTRPFCIQSHAPPFRNILQFSERWEPDNVLVLSSQLSIYINKVPSTDEQSEPQAEVGKPFAPVQQAQSREEFLLLRKL